MTTVVRREYLECTDMLAMQSKFASIDQALFLLFALQIIVCTRLFVHKRRFTIFSNTKVLTLLHRLMVSIHKAMDGKDDANFDWSSFAADFLSVDNPAPWGSWLQQLYLGTLRAFFHKEPAGVHAPTIKRREVRASSAQKRKASPCHENTTTTKKRNVAHGAFFCYSTLYK